MKNHIEHIIDELCELDPKLEKKRPELQKMIAEILKTKPDTKFDEAFKKKLYRQLIEKASPAENKPHFFTLLFMKPLPSLFSGAVLGAVAMFATTQYLPLYTQPTLDTPETASEESSMATYGEHDLLINSRGPGAFGALSSIATGTRGQGGGGGVENPAPMADSKMMIAPDMPYRPTHYQYNYSGELTLPTEPIEVLKRVRGKELLQNIPSNIRDIAKNMIDLSLFENIKLNSIDLLQDSKNGFSFNISFSEGMVSMFKQYEYRPYVEGQVSPTFTMPPDASLFAMTNDFMKKYNINLESYGTPEVNDYWKQFPENPVPQQITVVYPLLINGKTVYDQGGSKYGISVNVDLLENSVVSVWNIRNNQFDSSSYPAIADKEKVLAIAKKGGLFPDYYFSEEEKATVDLELGSPEEAYMSFYTFNQQTGQSDEVLVPSLIFTVTSEHKDDQYPPRQKIVIPLAKEIIEELEKQAPMPVDFLR